MKQSRKPKQILSDAEHVARLQAAADALNRIAEEARKDGLDVELYPNAQDTPICPAASRHYIGWGE